MTPTLPLMPVAGDGTEGDKGTPIANLDGTLPLSVVDLVKALNECESR